MADPSSLIAVALKSKLAAGSTLITELGGTAIFQMIARKSQALPYVIFQTQGGGDENTTPRRSVNDVWTVKGIASGLTKAEAIADEIDTLLHDQTLTIAGWSNFWMAREQTVRFAEVDEKGDDIWHIGAQYRIRLSK